MGKYNSTEQRISVPLPEYQTITQDSRVLNKALEDGWLGWDRYIEIKDALYEEDMNE